MYQLIEFKQEDIPILLSWIPNEKSLLIWTGPNYDWPLDEKQLKRTILKAKNSDSTYFLFKFLKNNLFVGYIELKILDLSSETALIGRLIIDPKARGRRFGMNFVSQIKKYAKEKQDIKTLKLGVYSINNIAKVLYEKSGFICTEIETKAVEYNEENWDLVLMECNL